MLIVKQSYECNVFKMMRVYAMEAGEGQSEKPHSHAELAKRGEELKRRPDDKRADIRSVRDAQQCVCT